MSAATPLSRRSTRIVWGWCLAYTAVAAPASRDRRRGEMRSHLWESEHAGRCGWALALAASRGAVHDLGWALGSGLPRVVRSFTTPTPYVVLAPAFPIQAWIVSATTAGTVAHPFEAVGAAGGGCMLLVAGLAWMWQRHRG